MSVNLRDRPDRTLVNSKQILSRGESDN